MDAFGYDAAALAEGQALLDAARGLYDAQIKEYGEQHAATQAFGEATKAADKVYAAHRRLAKIAFKNDSQRKTDLHLNERKPEAFNPWYEQARHFYTALLADTDAQAQLALQSNAGIYPSGSGAGRASHVPENHARKRERRSSGSHPKA